MDNSSHCGTSDSGRENSQDHNKIDKLSTGLSGELKISDGNRTQTVQRIPVERYYIEEDENEDDLSEEAFLAQMGYAKSESKGGFEDEVEEEEDLSENSFVVPPTHEPIMTPISDLIPVSALKGSREKEGKPPKECKVSWAPEVYDPPCTSDDNYSPGKTERHKSELKAKGVAVKNRKKCGGKGVGAIEGGGKGSKGAAGKFKDKKKADMKTKKRGGTASKYSDHDED